GSAPCALRSSRSLACDPRAQAVDCGARRSAGKRPGKEPLMSSMTGESWLTTTYEKLEEWSRTRSFWPLPFGTACCAIEFMGVVSSHYDVARFGYEVVRFSPRQSD